jgi:hypothetical protein
MSDNVRQLFEVNQFAPDPEALAKHFEFLAARVRDGSLPVRRCVLVAEKEDGTLHTEPFGGAINRMEVIGLLRIAECHFL